MYRIPRKAIPLLAKQLVLRRYGWECSLCNGLLPFTLEFHHIQFWSEDGSNDPSNLVPLCDNCHCFFHHCRDVFTDAFITLIAERKARWVSLRRRLAMPTPPSEALRIIASNEFRRLSIWLDLYRRYDLLVDSITRCLGGLERIPVNQRGPLCAAHGEILTYTKRTGKATRLLHAAHEIYRASKEFSVPLGCVAESLARVYLKTGRAELAVKYIEEAGMDADSSCGLNKATYLMMTRQFAAAKMVTDEALSWPGIRAKPGIYSTFLESQGTEALRMGKLEISRDRYTDSLILAMRGGFRRAMVIRHLELVSVLLKMGDVASAVRHLAVARQFSCFSIGLACGVSETQQAVIDAIGMQCYENALHRLMRSRTEELRLAYELPVHTVLGPERGQA